MVIICLRFIIVFLFCMLSPNVYSQDVGGRLSEAVVPRDKKIGSQIKSLGAVVPEYVLPIKLTSLIHSSDDDIIDHYLYHFVFHFLLENKLIPERSSEDYSSPKNIYRQYYNYLVNNNDLESLAFFQQEARLRGSLIQEALALIDTLPFARSDDASIMRDSYINAVLNTKLGDLLPDPHTVNQEYKGPKLINLDAVVPSCVELEEPSSLDSLKIKTQNMYNWDDADLSDDVRVPSF